MLPAIGGRWLAGLAGSGARQSERFTGSGARQPERFIGSSARQSEGLGGVRRLEGLGTARELVWLVGVVGWSGGGDVPVFVRGLVLGGWRRWPGFLVVAGASVGVGQCGVTRR
ncbi:hypothetical protein Skr01_18900 [Sphaerisporangium krabiense]|nr:hypothetical protein Skr01_18900 [Sphaerisporangium krabiense]